MSRFQAILSQRMIFALAISACLQSLATAQSSSSQLAQAQAACAGDVQKLCAGIAPGGGRIVACLKQHQDSLSDQCRQAAGLPPKSSAVVPPTPPSASSVPATRPAPSGTSAGAGKSAAKQIQVDGEKLVQRIIPDSAHANIPAATVHLPDTWKLDSKVEWHYDWVENPLVFSATATNPATAEAYFVYPLLRLESIEVAPQYRQYLRGKQSQPGQRMSTGAISMPQQPPVQALGLFIKQMRPDATNLKWVGQQDLPGLAQALRLSPWPNDHGVAIKVSYDLNGQSVEEAFFGVYYSSQGGNDAKSVGQLHMAANAIKQTNWGFRALQSFRARAGTLDKRMPIFCLIAKSLTFNPQWQQLGTKIHDQMVAAFNQKLQQGYDQIRASQAAVAQMQAQEREFNKSMDAFDQSLRSSNFDDSWLRDASGGGGSGGPTRSSFDRMDDGIRGVDTLNDPSTGGTIQLTNLGQYHFTDGFGNYRSTDDPNYTPEKAGEVGTWTQMTPVQ
jgi:hypothetical protein